ACIGFSNADANGHRNLIGIAARRQARRSAARWSPAIGTAFGLAPLLTSAHAKGGLLHDSAHMFEMRHDILKLSARKHDRELFPADAERLPPPVTWARRDATMRSTSSPVS